MFKLPKLLRKFIWKYLPALVHVHFVRNNSYGVYAEYYMWKFKIAQLDIYTFLVSFD